VARIRVTAGDQPESAAPPFLSCSTAGFFLVLEDDDEEDKEGAARFLGFFFLLDGAMLDDCLLGSLDPKKESQPGREICCCDQFLFQKQADRKEGRDPGDNTKQVPKTVVVGARRRYSIEKIGEKRVQSIQEPMLAPSRLQISALSRLLSFFALCHQRLGD